ncbi:hypothetical protein OY671_008378, partial [Metschnikowia pulcherrima]
MSEYRDSSTLGGKIGCGMAAFVGVPLIGVVFIVSSLGDCAPDAECHRGLDWPSLGGAIAIAAAVGFSFRCYSTPWKFGPNGDCVDIPGETHIPRAVRIFSYPAAERWGMIWAFNGETPSFDSPELPNVSEDEVVFRAFHRGSRPVNSWNRPSGAHCRLSRFEQTGQQHRAAGGDRAGEGGGKFGQWPRQDIGDEQVIRRAG